jgi:periplasmic divalent cation tolerance protein
MSESHSVVLTAVRDRAEAETLARWLVNHRLAACVQITAINSFYLWKDELQQDDEYLLLIKTVARRYDDIEAAVLAHHSYEVPEIVELPIQRGLPAYLAWLEQNTGALPPAGEIAG